MKKRIPFLLILIGLFTTSQVIGQSLDIYVSDGGNFDSPPWQILKFDQNGENPEVFINQNLGWPQDIVFLNNQNIVLISNLNTGRITKYNATNGDYLGNFATGISGPTRMKIGPDRLLYVLQWQGTGRVRRYQLDGTFVDNFTSVGVNQSIGLDWDTAGNLYVSSFGGNFVRQFDSNGSNMGIFVSSLQGPTNIWFDENGELLVCNWNGSSVRRYDANGNFMGNFITGLRMSEGVGILPNGNILIGNGGTRAVKAFSPGGNFIEDIIPSGAGRLLLPNAITIQRRLAVSIDEIEAVTDFIYPTIGTSFFLTPSARQKVEALEIYDVSGTLIEQKELTGSQIWNGNNFGEGIYIFKLKSKTGDIFTQKVTLLK